jgi:hypothetical protein
MVPNYSSTFAAGDQRDRYALAVLALTPAMLALQFPLQQRAKRSAGGVKLQLCTMCEGYGLLLQSQTRGLLEDGVAIITKLLTSDEPVTKTIAGTCARRGCTCGLTPIHSSTLLSLP